jgi:hypothetical protein
VPLKKQEARNRMDKRFLVPKHLAPASCVLISGRCVPIPLIGDIPRSVALKRVYYRCFSLNTFCWQRAICKRCVPIPQKPCCQVKNDTWQQGIMVILGLSHINS